MASTGTIDSNSYLSSLSIEKQNTAATEQKTSDKDMFMRLMLAQLKNQNPLQPQDGAEFLSQLAQFTQVEGIGKLNTSVQDIASLYRSTQTLQATALVGRNVQVDGTTGHFDGTNAVTGVIGAEQAATNVNMTVRDSRGAMVGTYSLGDISSDETDFSWNGTDSTGKAVPPGKYTISIDGLVSNKRTALNTAMNVRVNSVSITDNNGGMKLNLANGTSVDANTINQIL